MTVTELANVLDMHTIIKIYGKDGNVKYRRLTPEAATQKCGKAKVIKAYATGRYEMEVII